VRVVAAVLLVLLVVLLAPIIDIAAAVLRLKGATHAA